MRDSTCFFILLVIVSLIHQISSQASDFTYPITETNNNLIEQTSSSLRGERSSSERKKQQTFAACGTASTCQECSHSAKSMLQLSNDQYTCIWKRTSINDETNNQESSLSSTSSTIHPDSTLLKSTESSPITETLVCDLVPFSNQIVSQLSVSCSESNTMANQKYSKSKLVSPRKHNILPIMGSITIILFFITGLLRTRAFLLGRQFVPEIVWNHIRKKGFFYGFSDISKNSSMNNNSKGDISTSTSSGENNDRRKISRNRRYLNTRKGKALSDSNLKALILAPSSKKTDQRSKRSINK